MNKYENIILKSWDLRDGHGIDVIVRLHAFIDWLNQSISQRKLVSYEEREGLTEEDLKNLI